MTTPAEGEGTPEIEPVKKPGKPLTVPYDRFERTALERTQAKKELEAANTRITTLTEKAALADTATAELATTKARLDLALAGLTDEDAIEQAMLHHGKLPEADRPSLADWWRGLKAEGAVVPKSLGPWFAREDTGKPPPPKPPKDGGSDGKPPPTDPVYTADAVKALRVKAMSSRSAEDLAALEKAVDAVLAAKRKR